MTSTLLCNTPTHKAENKLAINCTKRAGGYRKIKRVDTVTLLYLYPQGKEERYNRKGSPVQSVYCLIEVYFAALNLLLKTRRCLEFPKDAHTNMESVGGSAHLSSKGHSKVGVVG